jgi:hypothetical protein
MTTAADQVTAWLDAVTVAEIVVIVAAVLSAGAVLRKAVPLLRRLGHLVDDLTGEPARPGVEARPSLMERVAAVERTAADTATRVAIIEHEVKPNHGRSLRDRVDQVADAVDAAPPPP